MAFASYKPVEPAGKGWGMAHLPHLELFVGEEQEITWPCPKLMVWELFELHKACIYAKSASSCVETLLDENWNDSMMSLPDGANRWQQGIAVAKWLQIKLPSLTASPVSRARRTSSRTA